MWKTVYDSVRGTSHLVGDFPCQDACRVMVLPLNDGVMLIACSADGAGSALHAAEGAEMACDTFVRVIRRDLENSHAGKSIEWETVLSWCHELRSCISDRASDLGVEVRQLATTFLGALVGESKSLFLQIGDGAIVTWDGTGYRPVFWPQSGEFANTTNFLTDEDFEDRVEWVCWENRVDELALFSDGLERLILRFAERSVHSPFLAPMFAALRAADNPDDYFDSLRQFLDSPRVNERTDDDKTLILATRMRPCSDEDAVR